MPQRKSKPVRNAHQTGAEYDATELRPRAALVRKILRTQVIGNFAQSRAQRKLLSC